MASQAPNFGSVLDQPSHEIERPKPLPPGAYVCSVIGMPRPGNSAKKQTEYLEYTLQPLEAGDDVDKDALEEMGGFGNRTLRITFYLTEDAIWRLKKFLDDCGVEGGDKKNPIYLRRRAEMAQGHQVIAYVRHEANEDGTAVYARINGTASAA